MAKQLRNETPRKLILHADNIRPHTTKSIIEFWAKLDLKVAPRPPDSPDLAPSDYFRFGDIKDKLHGSSFPSALYLHRATKQTMESLDRTILMATLDECITRVERCIQSDGEYFE
jgi:hypothetical protein